MICWIETQAETKRVQPAEGRCKNVRSGVLGQALNTRLSAHPVLSKVFASIYVPSRPSSGHLRPTRYLRFEQTCRIDLWKTHNDEVIDRPPLISSVRNPFGPYNWLIKPWSQCDKEYFLSASSQATNGSKYLPSCATSL